MGAMTDIPALQPYLDQAGASSAGLPGQGLGWLEEVRSRGLESFQRQGFPGPKVEQWRYTSLRPLERIGFRLASADAAAEVAADGPLGVVPETERPHRMVFVDGCFRADLSRIGVLPPGVRLMTLGEALAEEPALLEQHLGRIGEGEINPLQALNTAFLSDGAVLLVGRGAILPEPVELVFLSAPLGGEPTMHHPRILAVLEDNAEATVVEHHTGLGAGAAFSNIVSEIVVGQGARLHHYKLQDEGPEAVHIASGAVRLSRDASYDSFILTRGASLSRNDIRPVLAGTGVECRLSGAYMVKGSQHCDNTTVIDHAEPHCTSRQVYKGVIDDQARAVFQGKIVVRPGAQKTDGYQLNRALLLSPTAEIDSKPELEIYADDVKCSHGATAGELDDDQLFYLRARGLDRDAARNLLIAAFLADALEEIRVEAVRDAFRLSVEDWLQARTHR